jgi:hypothetical protein
VAEDPITGKVVPPKTVLSEKEREMGNLLDHFSVNDLRALCKDGNTDQLWKNLRRRRLIGIGFFVGCIVGVATTFDLLDNQILNFVPSMFQIGIGLSMMYGASGASAKQSQSCSTSTPTSTQYKPARQQSSSLAVALPARRAKRPPSLAASDSNRRQ